MNVLFLMIRYSDAEKSPNLYTDLAVEFRERGHAVYVATVLEKRKREDAAGLSENAGIIVLRVRCGNLFNVGFITKGITTVMLPYHFRRAIRKHFPDVRFDLVITPTPPITFLDVVRDIKRRHGASVYLILRDIFPQNARDLGLIGNPLLFRHFREQEKRLYAAVDHIGCMSPGNVSYLLSHNDVNHGKVELLPNWRRIRTPAKALNGNYREMDGRFVVVFGGVTGIAQELENLLDLAGEYRGRDDILFAIFGDGNRRAALMKLAAERNLGNVRFYGSVPPDEFAAVVRRADAGLVNLDRRFTIPNFPSKTLDYFEAGIPVLAAVDGHTDYGQFLDETNSGLWSVSGDLPSYRSNFERLLSDPALRKRLGANGRTCLEEKLTVDKAYETIVRHYQA